MKQITVKLRDDPDIGTVRRNFKITMINVLKDLVEKVGTLHEQLGDFSCDGNARKRNMPTAMNSGFGGLINSLGTAEERI